jgi:hypothetical protein
MRVKTLGLDLHDEIGANQLFRHGHCKQPMRSARPGAYQLWGLEATSSPQQLTSSGSIREW